MATTILLIDTDNGNKPLKSRLSAEGYEVVFVTEKNEAVMRLKQGKFDGVIVNPAMFRYSCRELIDRIRKYISQRVPILLITATGSLESCRRCPAVNGVVDCTDKPAESAEIVSRMTRMLRAEEPDFYNGTDFEELTPRERDVLILMRAGMTNREIAGKLFVTEKVIEKHVAHLCQKLGVGNRTEAVALSYRRKIL